MRLLFILITILLYQSAESQIVPTKFFVQFANKDNSNFSINRPLEFLSSRAVSRRMIYKIPVVYSDLPVSKIYLDSLETFGAKIHSVTKWFNGAVIVCDSAIYEQIKTLGFVMHGEPVFITKTPWKEPKIDFPKTDISEKRAHKSNEFNYGEGYIQANMLGVNCLHNFGFSGTQMWIAVLDAGFDNVPSIAAFAHLINEGKIKHNKDFVDGDNYVYHGSGHGTAVLSCMGAKLEGVMVGTAPNASYTLIRTEDVGSERAIEEFNWIAGAEYADSLGVDVFNTSLGYTDYDPVNGQVKYVPTDMNGRTTWISKAGNMAASKGILVVNSAGNEGNGSWRVTSAPSDADSVFCIGAVNGERTRAGFSSVGFPSVQKGVKPNVMAQGSGVTVLSTSGTPGLSNGTSFSGPVMAGAAACFWEAFPEYNNIQIMQLLQKYSDRNANPDSLYGYGIPDLCSAIRLIKNIPANLSDTVGTFVVYPNPSNGEIPKLYFRNGVSNKYTLSITDSYGRVMFNTNFMNDKFGYNFLEIKDFKKWNNGTYIIKVIVGTTVYTQKLVVN